MLTERELLRRLAARFPVGDDCFVLEREGKDLLLTTDMLHRETDFPSGLTPYSAGWHSAAVSFSDLAAMGGDPLALLVAYGAPQFTEEEFDPFLEGLEDACRQSGIQLSGGDLDRHSELTVVTTAMGESAHPVTRTGARPGELVGLTGGLGRTAAALELFRQGEGERANELFRFQPRLEEGKILADLASSMIDVSDGLSLSLHQLAEASDCGFLIDYEKVPLDETLQELLTGEKLREAATFTGGDFELLFTAPSDLRFELARAGGTVIGEVMEKEAGVGMKLKGELIDLEERGYSH